jgi:hypothetical protein
VVLQGPAIAVLTLKMTMEQPARMSRFVFICSSFAPDVRPGASGRMGNRPKGHRFRVARRISLLFNQALLLPATKNQGIARPICDHCTAEHSVHSSPSASQCRPMLKTVGSLASRRRTRQPRLQR